MAWTNEREVQMDLSLIQGGVPIDVVPCGQRPPNLNIREETEEEYYRDYVLGSGECSGPDLNLIKHMLNLVRDETETEETTQKTETNTETSNYVPIQNRPTNGEVIVIKKKNRNAAIESLIATHGDGSGDSTASTPKSKTPVNGIASPTGFPISFRRKSPSVKNDKGEKSENLVKEKSVNKPALFVPSSYASEKYKKYVEVNELMEQAQETIWTKLEKKMHEIDLKKTQEAAAKRAAASPSTSLHSSELHGREYVNLPQPRHQLNGDCVVCEVLCEKKQQTD